MIALAFIATLLGMMCLATAMAKHARVTLKRALTAPGRWCLRIVGTMALVVGVILCSLSQGISVGITHWLGLVSVGAFVIALLMTYLERSRSQPQG